MTTEKTDRIPDVVKAMDRIMDEGIVVETRIVVPSGEIYLEYAEAVVKGHLKMYHPGLNQSVNLIDSGAKL